MNRKLLLLPFLLVSTIAGAQPPATADALTGKTLGEAASHVVDLTKSITLEVEVTLAGPAQDIEPLVTYLRSQQFTVTGKLSEPKGSSGAGQSLALVGKKEAVFSSEAIDAYEKDIRGLAPKGLKLNWRMAQRTIDT